MAGSEDVLDMNLATTAPENLVHLFKNNNLRISMQSLPHASEDIEESALPKQPRKRSANKKHDQVLCHYTECLYHARKLEEVRRHFETFHPNEVFKPEKCKTVSSKDADKPILAYFQKQKTEHEEKLNKLTPEERQSRPELDPYICQNPECNSLHIPESKRKIYRRRDGTKLCGACLSWWNKNKAWRPKTNCDESKVKAFLAGRAASRTQDADLAQAEQRGEAEVRLKSEKAQVEVNFEREKSQTTLGLKSETSQAEVRSSSTSRKRGTGKDVSSTVTSRATGQKSKREEVNQSQDEIEEDPDEQPPTKRRRQRRSGRS